MKKTWLLLLVLSGSCVVPFDYSQESFERMMVVEGFITDQPGNHQVVLSWSSEFDEREFEYETDAVVTVTENGVREIPFVHRGEGKYTPGDPTFRGDPGNTYRLGIEAGGRSYLSDPVSIERCAEVESVDFAEDVYSRPGEQAERKTLRLLVTTREDPDASRYYRYVKEETWLVVATESRNKKIEPVFRFQNGKPVDVEWDISEYDNTTYCWPTSVTTGISIATTEGLETNRLVQTDVGSVNLYSDKVLYKYSALIKQFSIPKEVHHFLSLIKEFSEGEGTLFEVQPGFVEGNVHSLSGNGEQVIGIFYASQVKENRVFIRLTDLDPYYRYIVIQHARRCEFESVLLPVVDSIPDSTLTARLTLLRDSMMLKRGLAISEVIEQGMPGTDVVNLSNRVCIDCRGSGTSIKPEWWGEIF